MERDEFHRRTNDVTIIDSELEQSRWHVDLVEGENHSLQSAYADVEEHVRVSLAREGELEERIVLLNAEI